MIEGALTARNQEIGESGIFDTVIVPLDGSPHAEAALPYAIDEARRRRARMVLVHVVPRPEPCVSTIRRCGPVPWQGEWPFEEIDTTKREARAYLRGVLARFALASNTPLCVAVGDPGLRIAAEASRHPRPLVVMLTGDHTREAHPPLSLVASYLLNSGVVPVLAIGQPSVDSAPMADARLPHRGGASRGSQVGSPHASSAHRKRHRAPAAPHPRRQIGRGSMHAIDRSVFLAGTAATEAERGALARDRRVANCPAAQIRLEENLLLVRADAPEPDRPADGSAA